MQETFLLMNGEAYSQEEIRLPLLAMREIMWNPHTFMGTNWFDGVHHDCSHGLVFALQWVGVILEVKGPTMCALEFLFGRAQPGGERPPAGLTQLVKAQRG